MAPKKPPEVDLTSAMNSMISDAQVRIENKIKTLTDQRTRLQKKREDLEVSRNSMAAEAADLDIQLALCAQQLESIKLLKTQSSGQLYPE